MLKQILFKLKRHFIFLLLFALCSLIFAVSVKVTLFRYSNYEFGKFDLGNMSQLVYNTMQGRFMVLTDYFGENMPRWGMSHVDPFLVVFIPFYYLIPDARVLIVAQLALVIYASLVLYLIAVRQLNSKVSAFFIGLAYLFYPANGYLLAWTGFHGVTAVIPFFLLAFLFFEEMYYRNNFSKKLIVIFYLLILITMSGKEQISLIIALYGVFLVIFRKAKKIGSSLFIGGVVWFIICFFWIIPNAAHYRIEGYKEFAKSVGIKEDPQKDVLSSNYFLGRYDAFGDSLEEVIFNMVVNPLKVADVFFSGDKKENFVMTFMPVLFLPFFSLPVMAIAFPDILINYMTTSGGIGTSEIYNHRISMVVPIIFLACVFSLKLINKLPLLFVKRRIAFLVPVLSIALFFSNLYFSNAYQNPILLWFTQSLGRRFADLGSTALASDITNADLINNLSLGKKVKINRLETKDITCFDDVVNLIPEKVSVSAPDYLGAHLSTREINALFPANYDKADYVIVDIFSKKVATILGVDTEIVNNAVGKLVKDKNYKLIYSCSNIFVFKKAPIRDVESILPLQEDFSYPEKFKYRIGQSLFIVDSQLSEEVQKGEEFSIKYVYKKDGKESLNSYVLYTTFRHKDSGTLYQIANLPSFGINELSDWDEDIYYKEDNHFVLPDNLPLGDYEVFVGMTNNIKTANIFVGTIYVK